MWQDLSILPLKLSCWTHPRVEPEAKMSAELLLELPSKVVKVFALPQAPGASFQKSALVIVQSDSVSVAHGENGSLYHHYNFGRKTSYGAIVDCVYLFHQRHFLVAFQDSSLVVVPLDCKDVALCERAVWPKQPLKLQSVDGKSASLYCDGGYVCVVTISEEGSLPAAPTSWSERSLTQVSKESVFVQANSRYVASVSLRTSPAASSSVTPSKKKANAKKDSDSENTEYNLSVWSVPTLLSGASALLTAQSATTSTLALQAGETVVSVVFHARADSLSVITTTEKSSGRWLKVAVDGTILFERALSSVTSNAGDFSEVGDQLAVVTADRVLKYFDVRYGTEVRSVALSDSTANSPVSASWVLLFETDANKSSSAGGPASVQIFTSKMLKTSGPFNLYRRTLGVQTASALSSSLCQSIGKLAATTAENAAAAPLPAAQKRQLQDVSAQYQSQVQSEAAQDLKDLMDPAERQERKHRRLSVDVPQDAAKAFLTKFEARGKDAAAVEAWEWDLVKVLAHSGDLSVSRNPALITTAAAAKRIDVLAAIVEYVPDLSEKLCVRILAHLMLVAEADLAQLTVVDGIIHWSEQAQEKATDKKKTPKKASKAEEVSAGSEDRRLDLLRALVESTLRRASAFSAILLGEAVRALPLPCAVLLLQVVTHFVRGLCGGADSDEVTTTPVVDTRKVHLHAYVTDEEIKRAATWAEALLDGHFSALALHAVGHAGTRRALTYAMGTISGAEDGSELVQSTLGLWTHITRVIHNGGQQVKPITSLYQVEQLDLR